MQPTVDAELAGVRKILEDISSDASLPSGVMVALGDAVRTLQRVERHWSRVLPYLVFDNAAVVSLLEEIAPVLPAELGEEVATLTPIDRADNATSIPEGQAVNEFNERYRAVLSRAIASLPPGPSANVEARASIRSYLLRSLEERPW